HETVSEPETATDHCAASTGRCGFKDNDPLASPETGRDTHGRLALGDARPCASPPASHLLCLLLPCRSGPTPSRVERVQELTGEAFLCCGAAFCRLAVARCCARAHPRSEPGDHHRIAYL